MQWGIIYLFLEKSCGSLPNPRNGAVSVTGTVFGDVATYSCNGGYEVMGVINRTCDENGLWTGTEPVCAGKVYTSGFKNSLYFSTKKHP